MTDYLDQALMDADEDCLEREAEEIGWQGRDQTGRGRLGPDADEGEDTLRRDGRGGERRTCQAGGPGDVEGDGRGRLSRPLRRPDAPPEEGAGGPSSDVDSGYAASLRGKISPAAGRGPGERETPPAGTGGGGVGSARRRLEEGSGVDEALLGGRGEGTAGTLFERARRARAAAAYTLGRRETAAVSVPAADGPENAGRKAAGLDRIFQRDARRYDGGFVLY